ncbi:MAG: hypothetical protein IPP57_13525 [Candidatus Obscuribacter sp.]|nr:hypothetical protein [Candidatus Obscuribacter sp.]
MYSYSLPSSIIVLDAHSMREIAKIPTNSAKALDFCWSPDKKHLAYADDGTIHILDAITMIERVKIDGATNGALDLPGVRIATTSSYQPEKLPLFAISKAVSIWDINTGKTPEAIRYHLIKIL